MAGFVIFVDHWNNTNYNKFLFKIRNTFKGVKDEKIRSN